MAANEVSHHFLQLIVSARQPVVLDRHVLAFGVASFGQTFAERGHITHDGFWCCGVDKSDHRHRRLLRTRRKRPRRCRAAEQRDELATFHSITSSARASTVVEMSRPSALAVFMLITSSNLTGACTGSSLGLTPLTIRSA